MNIRLRSVTLLIATAVIAVAPSAAAAATTAAGPLPPARTTGTIVSMDWSSFTIQIGGRRMGMLTALKHAADAVTAGSYPYVYGGGHEWAGTASIGLKGPGYNGHRIGFDCSGSVAAVLADAGLWPAGSGVPADNGIIAQLRSARLIAAGAGTVTLFDKPGVHIFMSIDGRFFGTSDGGGGSPLNAQGGAGWLDDGAPDLADPRYRPYHLLGSVLGTDTTYGPTLTFQAPADPTVLEGLAVGDRVHVTYGQRAGTLIALAIS